jgi:hypothetical protein
MATDLELLTTIRTNLLTKLSTESANPKVSYSLDGQTVNYDAWYAAMWAQLEQVNKQLAACEGPWEVSTEGVG